MTKLTKEQIEQERVKFEEKFRHILEHDFFSGNFEKTDWAFRAWIVRAELDKGE